MLLVATLSSGFAAHAATIEVGPDDDLWAALAALSAGDELVVHAGTYSGWNGSSWYHAVELHGTEDAPIHVRADGDVIIEGDPAASQNIVDLSGEWYTWEGFEMVYGSHGLRVGTSSHGILYDLHIHDTGDVGLSMNREGNTYDNMVVYYTEVHDTGGTGECFYLGCNDGACEVSQSDFRNNWCHDTVGTEQGDGIELKTGSWGNTIADNVIRDTNYPGITSYGTGGMPANIIERNVVWNTADNGIQLVADAVVRNNLVFGAASAGIQAKNSQGQNPDSLRILHNTVVGAGSACARLDDAAEAADIVIANNALFCDGVYALRLGDIGATVLSQNAVRGDSDATSGTFDPGDITTNLTPGEHVAWPLTGSLLLDAGDPTWALDEDYNCYSRDADAPDVGAYERRFMDGELEDDPLGGVEAGFKSCAESIDGGVEVIEGRPPVEGDCGCDGTGAAGSGVGLIAGLIAARRRRPTGVSRPA